MLIDRAPADASGAERADGGCGLGVRGWRKGMGDLSNKIACNHAGLTDVLRGEISGEAVKIGSGAGGIPWSEPLCQ